MKEAIQKVPPLEPARLNYQAIIQDQLDNYFVHQASDSLKTESKNYRVKN
jgi:hypothetical protein